MGRYPHVTVELWIPDKDLALKPSPSAISKREPISSCPVKYMEATDYFHVHLCVLLVVREAKSV